MKTTKRMMITPILGLAMILTPFSVDASDAVELEILKETGIVRMAISNPADREIEITLYNANERELLKERIDVGETFESQIDFSELMNGTYTLVSTTGNMRTHKVLNVNNSGVILTERYISFIPMFLQKEDRLIVYFVDNPGTEVKIRVGDRLNNYLDTRFTNESGVFERTLSLNLLEPGSYYLSFISDAGEEFTHYFNVP